MGILDAAVLSFLALLFVRQGQSVLLFLFCTGEERGLFDPAASSKRARDSRQALSHFFFCILVDPCGAVTRLSRERERVCVCVNWIRAGACANESASLVIVRGALAADVTTTTTIP